jgi:lysophospholipase L1-like esterase
MENTILCYGDSNTWGYEPLTGMRLLRKQRWTGVLQQLLRESYYVVEEGLNGRTTVSEESLRDGRNGLKALLPMLESHAPLALVILMLGTNDLKHHLNVSAHEPSSGIAALVQTIHKSAAGLHDAAPPKILVVAPCLVSFPRC